VGRLSCPFRSPFTGQLGGRPISIVMSFAGSVVTIFSEHSLASLPRDRRATFPLQADERQRFSVAIAC
jgi:hypothetical protein